MCARHSERTLCPPSKSTKTKLTVSDQQNTTYNIRLCSIRFCGVECAMNMFVCRNLLHPSSFSLTTQNALLQPATFRTNLVSCRCASWLSPKWVEEERSRQLGRRTHARTWNRLAQFCRELVRPTRTHVGVIRAAPTVVCGAPCFFERWESECSINCKLCIFGKVRWKLANT